MTSTFRVNNVDRPASGQKMAYGVLTISSYPTNGESLAPLLAAMGMERAEVVVASGAGGRTFELIDGAPQKLKGYSAAATEITNLTNVGAVSVIVAGE